MPTQPGVFALGTTEHCYLEFDLVGDPHAAVGVLAALPATTKATAGVNIVVGVRQSLFSAVADPRHVSADVADWNDPLVGPDGFTMPATPHDLWVWVAGGDRSVVFDAARDVSEALAAHVRLARETEGWVYRHDRDLTGFIDGTENPTTAEAPTVASVPVGRPGEDATVLLFQLWQHGVGAWPARTTREQELAMGRTKDDSTELPESEMPDDAHVSRTTLEVEGTEYDIYRRNVAYGAAHDHGTVFVGFGQDQWRLAEMLRRMAGVDGGGRDALTRYVRPLTGAYYVVPSLAALDALASV